MPTLIEVWDSRLGIEEVAGQGHNPVILQWCRDAGHPEIIDDETAWCSTSMCSACKEAGLPFPPVNVNPMARSWLTMGVSVSPEDAQPGDIMVEPRGTQGWQGHVSMIRHVKREGGKIMVRNIGGNQTLKGTNGAITLTGWRSIDNALPDGIRRMVPATVKDLRPHSSTIKEADNQEKLGILGTFFVPIFEGARAVIEGMFGSVSPPQFAALPEGLSWWGSLLEQAGKVGNYALAHPWMAAILLVSIGLVVRAQLQKRGRVAEHQKGIPIGSQVAAPAGA
jgi:uncharacterized protein (TIGR02594 family)